MIIIINIIVNTIQRIINIYNKYKKRKPKYRKIKDNMLSGADSSMESSTNPNKNFGDEPVMKVMLVTLATMTITIIILHKTQMLQQYHPCTIL